MSFPPFLVSIPIGLFAIFYGLRSIRLEPLPKWRDFQVQDIGRELKETCTYVDDLKGCEGRCTFWLLELGLGLTGDPIRGCSEIILHEPSGVLFLSCAPPIQRSQWIPYLDIYNASGAGTGYIATYDPCSKKVTKLTVSGFKSPRGLSPFCMPSTHNPLEFTIHLINMRPPSVDFDGNLPPGIRDEIASARAKKEGPDPSIEVFRYALGSESMQHVATWEDEDAVIFPTDVVGLPDMEGFWFTNGYPCRAGGVSHSFKDFSIAGADLLPLGIVKLSLGASSKKSVLDWVLWNRWMQIRRNRA